MARVLTRLFRAFRVTAEISIPGLVPWAAVVFLGPHWFATIPDWALLVAFLAPFVIVAFMVPLFVMRIRYEKPLVDVLYGLLRVWSIWVAGVFSSLSTFTVTYWALSLRDPLAFSEPLSLSSAVYFTLTTFTTTGFGDIAARSEVGRLMVSLQMILGLGLVAVGLAIVVDFYARRIRNEP